MSMDLVRMLRWLFAILVLGNIGLRMWGTWSRESSLAQDRAPLPAVSQALANSCAFVFMLWVDSTITIPLRHPFILPNRAFFLPFRQHNRDTASMVDSIRIRIALFEEWLFWVFVSIMNGLI